MRKIGHFNLNRDNLKMQKSARDIPFKCLSTWVKKERKKDCLPNFLHIMNLILNQY